MTPSLQLHLAVLLFSGTALFSKLIPLPATEITALRSVLAGLALFSLLLLTRQRTRLHRARDYGIVVVLGMLIGLHWATYFAAMQYSTVAIGMIAFFCYPVMTVLAEPLLAGQRPEGVDLLSALTVLLGVILLVPTPSLESEITRGVLLGVLSAALFTARNLLQKRHFSHYGGSQTMAYQTSVAALMLLPWCQWPEGSLSGGDWGLLLLLGLGFTALPHALLSQSLRSLSAKTISLVSCLQPLYATALAAALLAEWPDFKTLLGGTLILAAALYETARAHRR
ncbi:DMT family transporter [Ferrimonas balearica]|uniref:DMT family transporter n=1 Tax=Ferrimonas balearica TaxID=44012 RepID=UPI001C99FCC8|nr:DMT family transporter [Ferrimonas balearica]MBY5992286.1 DMT family transporter [Ferrimonas balearica]